MSSTYRPLTLLCIASRFKGLDFLQEASQLGCTIYLITDVANKERPWPKEILKDIFYVNEQEDTWNIPNLIKGVAYLARTVHFDKIVPLDDYDFDKAAALREHLRVPGMGESRVRYFRDKLAMRDKAEEDDIQVPDYTHVLNYERIKAFTSIVTPPWFLKPRFKDASATYTKIFTMDDLWSRILDLGDDQSNFVIERFIPGDIFHVDSIVFENEIHYSSVHQFGKPLMDLAQEGGIMTLSTVKPKSKEEKELLKLNREVIQTMGLKYGIANTEFIRSHQDGRFYFIQSSGKVAGNYVAELVEASSGLNLWREWAKIEMSIPSEVPYKCPDVQHNHAMVIRIPSANPPVLSNTLNHSAIHWRQVSHNHVTLVIKTKKHQDLESIKNELVALL